MSDNNHSLNVRKLYLVIDAEASEIWERDEAGEIVSWMGFQPSGIELWESVTGVLRTEHQFAISRLSARRTIFSIENINSVGNTDVELTGRNLTTGLPQRREISTSVFQAAIVPVIEAIIENVIRQLEFRIPRLPADTTYDNEIILTGRYSLIAGLDQRFESAIRKRAMPDALVKVDHSNWAWIN